MINTIKCSKCGAEIEISEAFTHQIKEQALSSLTKSHKEEIENVKREMLDENNRKIEEERDRNKKLTGQISELLDEIKKLREKDEDREIEMKKKMMEEEERIKYEVRKKAEEEHQMKDLEKDKKLRDALSQIEDLKTKIEQGSQQTQGEAMELELEAQLKAEFTSDIITEVKKGQRGADASQTVVDKLGRNCGTILWESKNAKWTEPWIGKLKEDQRQAKAELAVLVSVNLPPKIESFAYIDGVWVCSWKHFIPLAIALRFNLISLFHERKSSEGKDEKMKYLYQYLTGTEFKHRVEGIVEAFGNLQDEMEREKRWFGVKWARQEKEIRKVIDHTHGMYGDLEAVIGRSLPEIKSLELPKGEK